MIESAVDDEDICGRHHGGNSRSLEANASISHDKNNLRRMVLDSIRSTGPATCEEIEGRLQLKHQTASARMSELKKMKLITPIGRRATSSGRNADVFDVLAVEVKLDVAAE